MTEKFFPPGDDDNLNTENEFLKMKIMLEHGGHFVGPGNRQLPADIENIFLNNILAFEKQFAQRKKISVFDKIGRPRHFKPVMEIQEQELDAACIELQNYLDRFKIVVGVCSPNIPAREVYRFIVEELFLYEMDDMELPGWSTHFIYDEFHPDTRYENSGMVVNELFGDIFSKEEMFYDINYDVANILFNQTLFDSRESLKEKISCFKSSFEKISLLECTIADCVVNSDHCVVDGSYQALAETDREILSYGGGFRVEMLVNEFGFWVFKTIQIEGFSFL